MADPNLIHSIIDSLQNYPDIEYELAGNSQLFIYGNEINGIDIALAYYEYKDFSEYKLNFNEYSDHFFNDEDSDIIIDLIVSCIVGRLRVKEFFKNNFAYKWELEVMRENEEWEYLGTTKIFTLNFWTKPQVQYLVNSQ